jgi:PAS domain S-box-containing protein
MVATRGRTPRVARSLVWLPLPLSVAAIAAFWVFWPEATHESRLLLTALNVVFSTVVSLFVASLCARSFLATGERRVLLLGCGVLVWGAASGVAAASISRGASPPVAIHNLGVWICGACSLAGAALSSQNRLSVRRPGPWLAVVYSAGIAAVALITVATYEDWMPVFFVQGQGGTLVRQAVLGTATAMLGVASALLFRVDWRSPSAFFRWYSPGLALLAVCLVGVSLETVVGGWLGWAARGAQYLGGVYLLIAGVAAVRDVRGWRISLAEALRASQERYAAFAAATFEGIVESYEGRIVACNRQFALIAGRPVSELTGMDIADLVAAEDRERVTANVSGNVESTVEHRMLRKDGSVIVVEAHGRPAAPGTSHRFTAVRDITARKQAEVDLAQLAAQRTLALDAAHMGWWHYDPAAGIAKWDDKYREIFGVTANEGSDDKILADIIFPDDQAALRSKFEAALNPTDPKPYAAEYRVRRPDGAIRWVEAHGAASFEGQGAGRRAVSLVGTVADVTDRKRSQARVERLTSLYAMLSQVNEAIVRIREERPLYSEICRIVAEVGGFDVVWVGEVDGRRVVRRASAGPASPFLDAIEVEIDGPLALGPTGRAIREGQPVIVTDYADPAMSPWREAARRHGIGASAAFPLRREGTTVGTLTLTASAADAFDAEEVRLLTALAADLSYALDAIRQEQRRLEADEKLRQSEAGRKVAEAVLVERKRLFDVLEALPAMISLLTPDYHVAFANRGFRDQFGESHGRRCYECCFGRSQPCEFCQTYTVLATGRPHRWEVTTTSGTVLSVCDLPFTDVGGSPMILEMALDITDSRRAERELRDAHEHLARRASQLRALAGELTVSEQRERRRLARFLHDHLQQLLVAAKWRAAVLAQVGDDSSRSAAAEIEQLLDTSVSEARTLTAELSPPILRPGGLLVDLAWLVRWTADKHGLTVNLSVEEDLPPLPDDTRVLLFESVRELLFNAAKHAHAPSIDVAVRNTPGPGLSITVSDLGAGFDPSQLTKAGEAGGGFGLFSIQERLDLLGGSMEIDSAPGRGSRFTLTVKAGVAPGTEGAGGPLPGTPVPGGGDTRADLPTTGPPIRVLIADDHAVVREGLTRLLGYEPDIEIVGEAADGDEAVALAATLKPDVILMDRSMPGLDGVEATRAIRRHQSEVRIIGLSMFDDDPHVQEMLEAGAVAYLPKSAPSGDLLGAIRHAGRSRR